MIFKELSFIITILLGTIYRKISNITPQYTIHLKINYAQDLITYCINLVDQLRGPTPRNNSVECFFLFN
jgi:hypothetical protein